MKRRVVFVQLPIPQPGQAPARGNVPLAAGYLHLYARHRGLESDYAFEILPARVANAAGDHALVEAILARDPWMVGFTEIAGAFGPGRWLADIDASCHRLSTQSAPGSGPGPRSDGCATPRAASAN